MAYRIRSLTRKLMRFSARPAIPRVRAALLSAALMVGQGFATTIDPLTWEELVTGADILAVVECETAGGIVAKYEVIDSWKGPETGQDVLIRTAVNAWDPQFPIALCGGRYLVAAYKRPPSTMMSTTGYGPVPLWLRKIPADYETPLSQGVSRLPLTGQPTPHLGARTRRARTCLIPGSRRWKNRKSIEARHRRIGSQLTSSYARAAQQWQNF